MHHLSTWRSGCLRLLLLACAVSAAGCGNSSPPYEADYSYEVLKKSADGTVTVVEKGQVAHATTGDGGRAGGVTAKVRGVSKADVTIDVTLPGNKAASLTLETKKAAEEFPTGSEHGICITASEIRAR